MIIPYRLVEANIKTENNDIVIKKAFLQFLLRQILVKSEFDEERYLRTNSDVAASVRQGEWASGKDHFIASGYFENREGAVKPVAESWYLRCNPDVEKAVKAGDWSSGETHFSQTGIFEWRAPNKDLLEVFALWKIALGCVPGDSTTEHETPKNFSDSA